MNFSCIKAKPIRLVAFNACGCQELGFFSFSSLFSSFFSSFSYFLEPMVFRKQSFYLHQVWVRSAYTLPSTLHLCDYTGFVVAFDAFEFWISDWLFSETSCQSLSVIT